MTTLTSFETRIATDYERGFVLRYLSEYCGGDSRGSLALCRGVARNSIERVRALHGNHEEVRGEYDTLADECISKFTKKILSADEFEITITKFDGTPMTLEHSAMVAFQYACRNRAFAYMPTLTTKHKLSKITPKRFNDSRCDHKIEPAHVADKHGDVVATISQSFGTDSGEFNPPENYYYTPPMERATSSIGTMEAGWIINSASTGLPSNDDGSLYVSVDAMREYQQADKSVESAERKTVKTIGAHAERLLALADTLDD